MRAETMIIEGVNGSKTRSIYYGIAVSSLGSITLMLIQVLSSPRWEELTRWEGTFPLAALFLLYAVLVIRSLCVPIPTITNRIMGEDRWSYVTVCIMVLMYVLSHIYHSIILSIFLIGAFAGVMAVKQLNWPVRDVCIQHVVVTVLLCCVSCYVGFQPHEGPAFKVQIGLATLSFIVNQILDKVLLPSTHDVVNSPFV